MFCFQCMISKRLRTAYTVTDGRALCIRHAIESSDMDDVDQDQTFRVIYRDMKKAGIDNPY